MHKDLYDIDILFPNDEDGSEYEDYVENLMQD